MKTLFPNLRRMLMVSAVGTPVLVLQAFFFLIGGYPVWAGVSVLSAIFLSTVLPFSEVIRSAVGEPKGNLPLIGGAMKLVGIILFVAWLKDVPEFRILMNRLFETNAFSDWRFVTAFSLCISYACLENWKRVRDLDDREIYAYYAGVGRQSARS